MEASASAPASSGGGPPPRGGYRGRGGLGMPMRGGFERGRGRGMGRGHYMGGMGRGGMGMGGPPPGSMMPVMRGMRPPRGMGYQGRGGFPPRGMLSSRGGRPPPYAMQRKSTTFSQAESTGGTYSHIPTEAKQHTGAENNKTVSPVPAVAGAAATGEASDGGTASGAANGGGGTPGASESVAPTTNGGSGGPPPHIRGPPRGRGMYRGGPGRGGYNPHSNGGMHGMMDHGQMPMRRGRGGYGQSMMRMSMYQSSRLDPNSQHGPVQSLKRGSAGGPPGPKRGRYEGGPYGQRPMAPKYHQSSEHLAPMVPQGGYHSSQNHHVPTSSHHAYQHDQSQVVDPYAQSYAAPIAQQSYNGYSQTSSYAAPVAQTNAAYATHHGGEYDQSQYQSYSATTYGTQQDTRYQTYGQDYTQQYGAPAVDYATTPQTDYTQHQSPQTYDDRAYSGYDAYQQTYSNTTGYY